MAGRAKSAVGLGVTGGVMGLFNHLSDGAVADTYKSTFEHFQNNGFFSLESWKDFLHKDNGDFDWSHALTAVATPLLGYNILKNGWGAAFGGSNKDAAPDADKKSGIGGWATLAIVTALVGGGVAAYNLNKDIKETVDSGLDTAKKTTLGYVDSAADSTRNVYESILNSDLPDRSTAPTSIVSPYKPEDLQFAMSGFAGASDNLGVTNNVTPPAYKDSIGFNDQSLAFNKVDGFSEKTNTPPKRPATQVGANLDLDTLES